MKIKITVKTNSGKQEIKKISEEQFKVYLKSNPENNKANIELLKFLKKEFKVKEVKIISGKTSRKKLIKLE